MEDVSFTYPEATRLALRDVSLTIRAGEVIALVGPSGAGKSAFASLLLRLADPQLGVVRLDGHDVRELTLDSVPQRGWRAAARRADPRRLSARQHRLRSR